MKISNETKVGILTITGLTVLILGFNFLKGKDLFKKSKKIYAVFTDLGSLAKSNEVKINGYVIGSVFSLDAKDKNLNGIVATINLSQDVNIPKNSKAIISSPLVGASFILIQKGDGTDFLAPGDTIQTMIEKGIMDQVTSQLNPTLTKVRTTLDSLNTVFSGVNSLLNAEAKLNIQQTLANFNRASSALNGMLDQRTGALAKTLNNTEALTGKLLTNTDDISATIKNAKLTSEKLAALELKPTIDALNATVNDLKSAVAKISSKEGTLGALINDKTLYNKLNDAILSAEILMDDLRTNPKRYVNISVFGKKDKDGPITSPAIKDSIPK
ncbi:MAG: MlaD family protein [Chitinophagaceae bacterium]